jgi:hypothetical protein
VDLNTLVSDLPAGTVLTDAYDINNAGQILARANNGTYVLTPIPEPATLMLLLSRAFVRSGREGGTTNPRAGIKSLPISADCHTDALGSVPTTSGARMLLHRLR